MSLHLRKTWQNFTLVYGNDHTAKSQTDTGSLIVITAVQAFLSKIRWNKKFSKAPVTIVPASSTQRIWMGTYRANLNEWLSKLSYYVAQSQ